MSKAKTKEEVRKEFLDQIHWLVRFWATDKDEMTILERCDGVAFSILTIIDGSSMMLPAFNLSTCPNPEDKQFHIQEGSDYYENGMIINDDVMLHDEYSRSQAGE